MDNQQKVLLEQKKKQLQLQIAVQKEISMRISGWLSIYDEILENKVEHSLHEIEAHDPETLIYWQKALNEAPLIAYQLDSKLLNFNNETWVQTTLYRNFPSQNPLRFVPPLMEQYLSDDVKSLLETALTQKDLLDDTELYLCYLYYYPVIKIKLNEALKHANLLFDHPLEDIALFTTDRNWLFFKSMEDQYYFGSKV
ncbi:hypothetical protein [Pedobacter montanisoli]|uniref:Uncharacterized protein n=1 Tax=Pedobacter montanisoli TaxID=2923277 RepID=A0ABS9ZYE7_9SPHI|nr:hypothetical protein [Pedobacter montanisoli]MCJ0743328.1 hypothetical protein [Pedobacter montanisoli]